jgi:hypothetical protein
MNRREEPVFRRGYLFALIACLVISFLYGFKYVVFLNKNPTHPDYMLALVNMNVLFVISGIASFFTVRWYYRLKDKN